MIRLFMAQGPWQLISMATAFEHCRGQGFKCEHARNVLLLSLHNPVGGLADCMQRIAVVAEIWDEIHWVSDYLTLRPPDVWPVPVSDYRSKIGSLVGENRITELWLPHFHSFAEKILAEAFPEADVVFCEEGLDAYMKVSTHTQRLGIRHFVKHPGLWVANRRHAYLSTMRLHNWRVDTFYARRVRRRFLLLGDKVLRSISVFKSEDILVPARTLNQVLHRISDLLESAGFVAALRHQTRPCVILLPERLIGFKTRDRALTFLFPIVDEILCKGYNILWKDHPREHPSLYWDVRTPSNADRVLWWEDMKVWPSEVLALPCSPAACVGGVSSSLWYLHYLLGIPGYSYGRDLIEYLQLKSGRGAELYEQFSQQLEDLPEAKESDV